MKKVYYSYRAKNDLIEIFRGLLHWKKHEMTIEHVQSYIEDIQFEAKKLLFKAYHIRTKHLLHKQYGRYKHRYQKHRTSWYLIYNIDVISGNVFIEKILNNYITVS